LDFIRDQRKWVFGAAARWWRSLERLIIDYSDIDCLLHRIIVVHRNTD